MVSGISNQNLEKTNLVSSNFVKGGYLNEKKIAKDPNSEDKFAVLNFWLPTVKSKLGHRPGFIEY